MNYKHGVAQMSDEEVLKQVHFYNKYVSGGKFAATSNLTKAVYFENVMLKRGWTEAQITAWCNAKSEKEYA